MENMIQINNLSVQYNEGDFYPIQNIDLEIKKGECIALIGASGCGKTSLIRAINGLAKHYYEAKVSGEILLENTDLLGKEPEEISEIVGTLFQNPKAQFFNMDTGAELIFGCENLGMSKDSILKRVRRIIQNFNLSALMNRNIFELSGGEKQKIALASILAMNPKVLLLDEPTSNLDVAEVGNLERLLPILKDSGKTIILSEHRMYWLKRFVDRYILMKNGKIERIFERNDFLSLCPRELHELGIRSFDLEYRNEDHLSFLTPFKTVSFKSFRNKGIEIAVNDYDGMAGVIGIIGHNGSGKSTLVEGMLGLLKTKGTVLVDGEKISMSDCSFVMQDVTRQLFCETVIKEASLTCECSNDEIEEVLKKLNLYSKKNMHPQILSGGEKQRLCIASSALSKKKVCIMDEPTSGLDFINMNALAELIDDLRKQKVLVIMITHDFEMLFKCCDTIIELNNQQAEVYSFSPHKMKNIFWKMYMGSERI